MSNPFNYFDRSIKRMIMLSFLLLMLIPISFSISSLYENTWSHAEQSMLEKHALISEALVEPFTLFITARLRSLTTLGDEILTAHTKMNNATPSEGRTFEQSTQTVVDKYFNSFDDLANVSFISLDKEIKVLSTYTKDSTEISFPNYSKLPLTFLKIGEKTSSAGNLMSPAFISKFTNKPVVLLKHYIRGKDGNDIGAICAEVSLKYIENMCSKINFGVLGHCATVDQTGHVIAHPNKSWIKEIRDLSKVSAVQKMMAGLSGTTEFYSPFMKEDMVAGYSAIPALGWGVMIPQPKSELTQSFDTIRFHTFLWLFAGIIVALFLANFLMKKITSPINNLILRTNEVKSGHDYVGLGIIPKNSPSEIKQLWKSFATLLVGLQESNTEVKRLNISLNKDIDKATKELRDMNKHLYEISNQDYLTTIANRRHFNNHLDNVLDGKRDESVGIIVIDLDKFKQINDKHGHDAGDLVLQHVSQILNDCTRSDDLVARLGGDEFAVYVKNLSDIELKKLAEKISITIQCSHVKYKKEEILLTASIGIINYVKTQKSHITLDELLDEADKAMYLSKQNGRNQVILKHIEEPPTDRLKMEIITV